VTVPDTGCVAGPVARPQPRRQQAKQATNTRRLPPRRRCEFKEPTLSIFSTGGGRHVLCGARQ
jgi:hypothetical protein